MRHLPNLYKNRFGVFYLRLYVDRKEQKISLRTKDWSLAKLLVSKFHFEQAMAAPKRFEADLSRGIFKTDGTPEDAKALAQFLENPAIAYRLKQAQPAQQAVPVANTPRLKPFFEAVEEYLETKKLKNADKTIQEKQRVYSDFLSLYPNLDTNEITKDHAVAYKNRLIKNKAGNSQINKKLSYLKDFLDYATDHGYYTSSNPFEGLSVEKTGKDSFSYDEFTDEELKTIFDSAKYGSFMNRPNYYWLPLLAVFSGARLNELAGTKVDDIYQTSGVWVLNIPPDRAKNKNSVRKIPLHKTLIEIGFLDYFERIKALKPFNNLLFPELLKREKYQEWRQNPFDIDYGKNGGRRFGEYLDELKITQKEKVFHSFRSTVINRLTNVLGIHPAHIMGLVGHIESSKIDFSSPHFQNYQKKKPIEFLAQMLNKLSYDFIDFEQFKR